VGPEASCASLRYEVIAKAAHQESGQPAGCRLDAYGRMTGVAVGGPLLLIHIGDLRRLPTRLSAPEAVEAQGHRRGVRRPAMCRPVVRPIRRRIHQPRPQHVPLTPASRLAPGRISPSSWPGLRSVDVQGEYSLTTYVCPSNQLACAPRSGSVVYKRRDSGKAAGTIVIRRAENRRAGTLREGLELRLRVPERPDPGILHTYSISEDRRYWCPDAQGGECLEVCLFWERQVNRYPSQ
jgi:hypothetical protein